MANIVKSVEFFDLIVGGTTNSGTFSKNQDTDNCVPFFSGSGGSNVIYGHMTDIYFSSAAGNDYVNVERITPDATKYCHVYVVEFDPNEVKVQQGTFSMSGTSQTVTISGVDLDHTAMVFYHKGVASNRIDYNMVKGKFNSSSQLEFARANTNGTINGHYYVFEALNDQFSVQHINWGGTGTSMDAVLDPEIGMSRSLLLSSYYPTYPNPYPGYCFAYVFPWLKKLLRWNRNASSYNIYVSSFYIIFNDNKHHSQHRFINFGSSDTSSDFDLTRAVDLDYSMVICDNFQSSMRTNYNSSNYIHNGFCLTALPTASGVTVRRNNSGAASYSYVQVFDWKGIDLPVGSSTPLDPTKTFVKSVENITLELDGREHYVDALLTKGQNISNCVPFTSLRANVNNSFHNKFANIWFEEPGLICMQRTGVANTTICNISVVEFYPDQVHVQSGPIYFDATTSISTTISGVVTDKTALIFSGALSNYSAKASYVFVRGTISSSTELSFYRVTGGDKWIGTYFIFEDLKSNFKVESLVSEFSDATSDMYTDMEMEPGCTFLTSSYAIGRPDYYPSYALCAVSCRGTKTVICHRYGASYTVYQSTFIVKFLDGIEHVSSFVKPLVASDIKVTLPLEERFEDHIDDLTVFNAESPNTYPASYTSSNYLDNGYISLNILAETNNIEMERESSGVTAVVSGQVIDWVGYRAPTISGVLRSKKSFVQSVEKVDFTLVDNTSEQIEYLTKGQVVDNCVPFYTYSSDLDNKNSSWKIATTTLLYPKTNKVVAQRGKTGGSADDIDLVAYIVEFNPKDVKIQHGHFYVSGLSISETIDEVDLDRAFIVLSCCGYNTGLDYRDILLAASFSDSSTVLFERKDVTGVVMGQYYVVESLTDVFKVQQINGTMTGSDLTVSFPDYAPNEGSTVVVGTYTTDYSAFYPGYGNCRVRRQLGSVNINRYGTTSNIFYKLFGIEFSKRLDLNIQFVSPYFAAAESSKEYKLNKVDTDRAIVLPPLSNFNSRVNYNSNAGQNEGVTLMEITESGTGLLASKGSSSYASYSSGQVVEFSEINKYYFDGNVTEQGLPAGGRIVRAYRKDTGYMVDETTSASGTGYFYLETTYSGTHDIVCLDDMAGYNYNDLIFGDVIPTTLSGA